MSKRVLVLGATGAMGQHLVPILVKRGYTVDAIANFEPRVPFAGANFHKVENAKDPEYLRELLSRGYDAIVDFLIYPTRELCWALPWMLRSTDQYIYFSSYRIYDNKEVPIKETSPRLLDASENIPLRNSDDYSVYKARGENILLSMPRKNWTAVRPAITYSLMRYQLVTHEASNTVGRAFQGKKTVLPIQAKNVQATMSWAGDIAMMLANLLFNEKALGEIFTVATAEHHTWGEIADYYKDICGLESVWVDKEDYLNIIVDPEQPYAYANRWQLDYDRLFERVMDNSKVLAATGMKQEELMPLYKGLEYEIGRCPRDFNWGNNDRMDAYLERMK